MNKLTQAQILALFLGTARATDFTPAQFLAGPATLEAIPTDQTALTTGSRNPCGSNADCSTEGEKCANFQIQDQTAVNLCVADRYCGSLGRINGNPFYMPCWEDPADGEVAVVPEAQADLATFFADVEGLITKETVSWDGIDNIFVSSRYNWQDGWWTLDTTEGSETINKWVETDKPADNRCFIDIQCDADHCCGDYPDTNNKRCIAISAHNVELTLGPVSFTPICESQQVDDADGGDDPLNGGDNAAAGALAEAAEALGTYWNGIKEDAQGTAGYAEMSDEDKAAWDLEWEATEAKRGEQEGEWKTLIGYDTDGCDDNCKERMESELLKFYKARFTACSDDAKDIFCVDADNQFKEKLTAAVGDAEDEGVKNWFSEMDDDEREAFNTNWDEEQQAKKSALAAAWVKENMPGAGEEGSACDGGSTDSSNDSMVDALLGEQGGTYGKCTTETQCCGDSTQTDDDTNKLENVCVDSTSLSYTDPLGRTYTHVCQAAKLFAAAAAAATLCTSLM